MLNDIKEKILLNIQKLFDYSKGLFCSVKKSVNIYIADIKNYFSMLSQIKKGNYSDADKKAMCNHLNDSYKPFFGKVLNVALPIVTGVVMITAIAVPLSSNYALKVSYNGKEVGYVENEQVYYNSMVKLSNALAYESSGESLVMIPTLSVCKVDPSKLSDSQDIADRMLEGSETVLEEACGVFIDGDFVGAMNNEADALSLFEQIKSQYKSKYPDGGVEYVSDIKYTVGLYASDDVIDSGTMVERLFGVESEDDSTKALSKQIDRGIDKISESKKETVLSVGILKAETKEKELDYSVEERADPNIYVGYTQIAVKGKQGLARNTDLVTYVNGKEVTRSTIASNVIEEPINEVVLVGTKQSDQSRTIVVDTDKTFIWPVDGGWISSRFCTPDRPTHRALDIAASPGTDIYAATSGVVTYADWVPESDGGGMVVTIDHGNGFQTRYCHCSVMYVKAGDIVEQGEIIAGVGSTGNSTGPHLHFMVKYNGVWYDPELFLPDR